MRKMLLIGVATWLVLGYALSTHALLIDRGGGMIYSTGMDITILQDANLAMTSGYDEDGYMTWAAANTWAQNLTYGGYYDWRLPTFDPDFNRENAGDPGGVQSELTYLRYVELGPLYDLDPSGFNFDPAPFFNLGVSDGVQEDPRYWSGSLVQLPEDEIGAWNFYFW